MALQTTTLCDLRRRLDEIETERREAQRCLSSLIEESAAIGFLLRQSGESSAKRTRADHIRDALLAIREGSPKDVAEEMTKRGWNWNGVTPSTVVGVELHRLATTNGSHVEKVERGLYRYKE